MLYFTVVTVTYTIATCNVVLGVLQLVFRLDMANIMLNLTIML